MTLTASLARRFERDGFVHPVRVLSEARAADHAARLDRAEARIGPLHYRVKPYLLYRSPFEIASAPLLVDAVEAVIGPDVLLWDGSFVIKEPGGSGFISWHQDLTYWGLDGDDVVTAWVALGEVSAANGCMQIVPGSHRAGRLVHTDTHAADNILHRGQQVEGVDVDTAVPVELAPGEASLHHGWVVHRSEPNRSSGRRLGLSLVYLAPSIRQRFDPDDSATLVRGEDRYGHFRPEPVPPAEDLSADAIAFQAGVEARKHDVYDTADR